MLELITYRTIVQQCISSFCLAMMWLENVPSGKRTRDVCLAVVIPYKLTCPQLQCSKVGLSWDATAESKWYVFSLDVCTNWNPKLLPENDEWTTIVVHSRDDEEIGMAHKIVSPKNQPQVSQMIIGQIKLNPNRLLKQKVATEFSDWPTNQLPACLISLG